MSYLGRSVDAISNVEKLDNITFNGGTTYALTKSSAAFTPAGKNNILISVSGVVQQGNFSVSGSNIVFDSAVAGTETCDFIMHYGTGLITTPADDTVAAASIKTDAVTTAKIQNDAVTVDKVNLISTSSVPSLEAKGTSGQTEGYIQLNCAENSHGIKLKSPPHSASQSYTLTFPSTAPSADKFIKTDGSGNLSFAEAGGGGMDLIASVEGTSSVGDVSINDCFSATYDNYFIIYTLSPDRDGNYINIRFQKDDDTTFNSLYNTTLTGYDDGGTFRSTFNGSHSDMPLHQTYVKNDTTELFGTVLGFMYVYHPYTLNVGGSDLLRRVRVLGQSQQIKGNGSIAHYSYSGQLKQNGENVAGIRFRPNANYITHRRVRVYGLKDS
mgnify:FL=1